MYYLLLMPGYTKEVPRSIQLTVENFLYVFWRERSGLQLEIP